MSSPNAEAPPGALAASTGTAGALAGSVFAAVAVLSGVAAGIHLGVAPEHFTEWWGYGAFFVLAAAGECALVAVLALRPRPWVIQVGIWATLATMVVYLLSRTSGIPLGPSRGVVEPVEPAGLVAAVAEAALVVVLCDLLAGKERTRTLNALALVGGALWIAALTGALAPPAQPVADGHSGRATALHAHAPMGVPFIPDRVRNAPRIPGDG